MYHETPNRSLVKTISYRCWSTLLTSGIVFAFTSRWEMALAIGGVDMVTKLILYFWHERLWNRIHYGRHLVKPTVIWFTGLSGSGKSTVANAVYDELRRLNLKVERLDGDAIRNILPQIGFGKSDRDQHIRRVGYLASILEKNGIFVVASFISPYHESRDFVRQLCENFIEIYVNTPLAVCEQRDVKGLYQKARRGEITQFTGIDDPYEAPEKAELTIDTSQMTMDQARQKILVYLKKNKYF